MPSEFSHLSDDLLRRILEKDQRRVSLTQPQYALVGTVSAVCSDVRGNAIPMEVTGVRKQATQAAVDNFLERRWKHCFHSLQRVWSL
jgi:hypothetical protein